jgi:hypothetical protein
VREAGEGGVWPPTATATGTIRCSPQTRLWPAVRRAVAGVPGSWLDDGEEFVVTGLPTHYGRLDFRLRRIAGGDVLVSVTGIDVPPGGVVLRPPLAGPLTSVAVNGRPVTTFDAESATVTACPAEVVLRS